MGPDEKPEVVAYQFKGIPLTAAIARSLIVKLFQGQLVERQVIDDEILRAHLSGGGAKPSRSSGEAVRKALLDMKNEGLAENVSMGHWRIANTGQPSEEQSSTEIAPPLGPAEENVEDDRLPAVDLDVGTGVGAVYLYYLPTYRLHAENRGEKSWPCKIGRTDRDPVNRVLSQAATALPEKPHIALIVRTSQPLAWESALHGVLTLRGLRIENSPGVEWFLTSPQEVLDLVKQFDQSFSNACFTEGA